MSKRDEGDDERVYWLALHRAPGVGPRRFQKLLEHFGSARATFEAGVEDLVGAGIREADLSSYLQKPDWGAVERDLAWLNRPDRQLLRLTDATYPVRLRQIANPPPLLFVQGDLASLNDPQLAIVGSRNPTTHGEQIAFDFSKSLARSGLIITSGLALGIDAAAHRGALAAGGITIAVAATGLDRIYPARNQELAWRIIEQGAIVSEFPVDTPILAQNFPQRNRIISGLCLGTLVVEARARSGSLMTARYALEQGREVFAVPGAINNPLVRGCHALIREGATLVECLDNILTELGPLLSRACPTVATASETVPGNALLDEEYRRLLDGLGVDEPTAVDTLVGRTGLTAHSVSSMLLLLEMQGYVSSLPGGLYIRHR